jgi:tetratricopeptide (TPR) repeat protein
LHRSCGTTAALRSKITEGMKPDAIAYIIAGMCFGVILGWVIGTEQAGRARQRAADSLGAPAQSGAGRQQAPQLDLRRVQELEALLERDPQNADAAVQLANTYFDAERWEDAIRWYQRALEIDPNNPNASTDLGVSYYYTNRPDQALKQFDYSLKLDPKHTKTLLNKGIVLAFGKQDLQAAAEEWKKVVELAPDSPEGQAARRALEGLAAAHAEKRSNN